MRGWVEGPKDLNDLKDPKDKNDHTLSLVSFKSFGSSLSFLHYPQRIVGEGRYAALSTNVTRETLAQLYPI